MKNYFKILAVKRTIPLKFDTVYLGFWFYLFHTSEKPGVCRAKLVVNISAWSGSLDAIDLNVV